MTLSADLDEHFPKEKRVPCPRKVPKSSFELSEYSLLIGLGGLSYTKEKFYGLLKWQCLSAPTKVYHSQRAFRASPNAPSLQVSNGISCKSLPHMTEKLRAEGVKTTYCMGYFCLLANIFF